MYERAAELRLVRGERRDGPGGQVAGYVQIVKIALSVGVLIEVYQLEACPELTAVLLVETAEN